jgi:hypothetical protein
MLRGERFTDQNTTIHLDHNVIISHWEDIRVPAKQSEASSEVI